MRLLVNDRWRFLHGTFPKFAAVGMINTLLTIVVIFALKSIFGVADVTANAAGYAVGLGCSFLLNKRWTFRHDGRLLPTLSRFLGVFGMAYVVNIVAVLMLIRLEFNDYLAHIAGMPLYTFCFYLGCHFYVFPPQPGYEFAHGTKNLRSGG